ncbi:geranylgeranyl diphosphate synthase CrtE [soil metagenome]
MSAVDTLRSALAQAVMDALPTHHANPDLDRFYALLRDYPARGGKALRGLFTLLSAEAHGGRWQDALDVAAALELFQSWVLVHDDIEDDSDERRGAPALHKTVGMPIALNVGDALHVYMWSLLHGIEVERKGEVWAEFVTMIHRTAEGQHLDLSWVQQNRFDITEADYLEMVRLKSAFYTVVSPLKLGAICAGRTPDAGLEPLGTALGVAFQIRDDVLNLTPGHDGYGKEFAGDLYEAKRTLILAHLFACARADEAEEVTARLGKPRIERTAEDVTRVLELVAQYRSLAYAQSVAEQKAKTGLTLLADVTPQLANQAAADKLSRLLETLSSRPA